ncbi:hypothetical protein PISMIDRAFT_122615 [Pisolithus microcarpus 441]|uniref:Uncharacterized protein n=1 Tax=Pisolithus microcarpus 441 TaxID=765257 RepID=A0A0C9XGT4_9AGAM|nr:hypothetical protein BKA83DRAFT_122615 [Pisolithus microcarpus]KIK11490.1 hypothetical protein PISMIDRAFT_122615 [Pisolithus microcarpus 441]
MQVPELELLWDVKTCWDSSCIMINHLHALHPALDYFLALPNQKELEGYALSPSQWLVLEDFKCILQVSPAVISQSNVANRRAQQVPLRVQQRMSSESLPHLGSAVPCFELLMSAWETLGETDACLASGKF